MAKQYFDNHEEVVVEKPSKMPIIMVTLAAFVVILILAGVAVLMKPPATPPVDAQKELFPGGVQSTPVALPETGEPTTTEIAAAKSAGTRHAIIKTAKGDILVDLYGADMPITVANFVKLAKKGFYNGLTFHRVETQPGFQLIQGGDPNGTGSGGPGYSITRELNPKLKHETGIIAMARSSDPDSAGSQFYITLCPTPALDRPDGYAVFGKVTKGLENAKKIVVGDKILSITVK